MKEVLQVRATLNIPDRLIDDLIKETQAKTKTRAITLAIEDYLQKKRLEKLIALQGKLDLKDTWREMEALELEELGRHGERKNNR
jgi:hypothetical protein